MILRQAPGHKLLRRHKHAGSSAQALPYLPFRRAKKYVFFRAGPGPKNTQNRRFPVLRHKRKPKNHFWVPEGSLAGILWVGLWGLGGPWGLENHPKMWGAKPPTFLDGFKAPRGRPDPKNRPKKFRPDCLQVPSVGGGRLDPNN